MVYITLAEAVDQGAVVSERVKNSPEPSSGRRGGDLINFNTYHPQGMVKIGDTFFPSTVDIKSRRPATRSCRTDTTATPARAPGI
jgi:hypothetical protein